MQITKQNWLPAIINFAVTLFFLSIFIVKGGYNAAPALLMLIGLGYGVYALIKKPLLNLSKVDKWLIYSYLFYFLTFVKYGVTLYGTLFSYFALFTNSQNVHASIPEL